MTSGLRWSTRKSVQPDPATEGIDHAEHLLQAHRGLAGLQIDHEAHAHPGGQGQIGLRQAQLLACGSQGRAECLCGVDWNHGVLE